MNIIYIMDMEQKDGTFSIKQETLDADGNKSIHRFNVFEPGQFDRLDGLPEEIQEKAKSLWTPEIVASYERSRAEIQE